jgi:hypothetical protein
MESLIDHRKRYNLECLMVEDTMGDAHITVGTVAVIAEGVLTDLDIIGDFTDGFW